MWVSEEIMMPILLFQLKGKLYLPSMENYIFLQYRRKYVKVLSSIIAEYGADVEFNIKLNKTPVFSYEKGIALVCREFKKK